MFQSLEFEENSHSYHYPKTAINFFPGNNNSSTLEPWNKTSYFQQRRFLQKSPRNIIKYKERPLNNCDAKKQSRKSIQRKQMKTVPISSMAFFPEPRKTTHAEHPKRNLTQPINKYRRSSKSHEKMSSDCSIQLLGEAPGQNRGLKITLNPATLIKKRMDQQNRLKTLLLKKQLQKKNNASVIVVVRQNEPICQKQIKSCSLEIQDNGVEQAVRDTIKKRPKKAFFVGMRKIMRPKQ